MARGAVDRLARIERSCDSARANRIDGPADIGDVPSARRGQSQRRASLDGRRGESSRTVASGVTRITRATPLLTNPNGSWPSRPSVAEAILEGAV